MSCTDGTVEEPAHDVGGGRLAIVTGPDGGRAQQMETR